MNFEKEILSELLDAKQFDRVLALLILLLSLVVLQVFTPLYRGVKKNVELPAHPKRVV